MSITFLDRTPRFLLYALFLLLPVFIVPGLGLPLDFHKQLLLAVVVFVTGLLWIIDILRKGEVSFRWHILFVPLGIFVLVAFISVFGSGAKLHSFWGANAEPDSFFNILLFALLFVLIVNKLTKPEHVRNAVIAFVGGAVFGALFLFANSLFSFTFPFDFAQGGPFGSPFAFAIYGGGAFLVVLAFILTGSDPVKSGPARLRRNILGSDPVKIRIVAAAILFLAVLFVTNPLSNVLKVAPEVRLGRQATIGIAKDTIFSNVKNALFGSGPATFMYQYRLHKNPSINNTPFWNVAFDRGSSAIVSFFVTLGALGGGAVLMLWMLFAVYGAKTLFGLNVPLMFFKGKHKSAGKKQKTGGDIGEKASSFMIFVGGFYFFIAWLLYQTNFLLLFAGFLMLALWVALQGKQKEIIFSKSSQGRFWGVTGSVALFIVLIFGSYTVFRSYTGAIYYERGIKKIAEKNYPSAISLLQKAAKIRGLDKHWQKLFQVIFLYTTNVFQNEELPKDKRDAEVWRGIGTAEVAAAKAVAANSLNSINYEQFGDFYIQVMSANENAVTLAFSNYEKAASLNPLSPFIPLKKARAHFANAKRFAAKDTDRAREAYAKAIEEARKEANNALMLKEDFVDAIEFIATLPK